MDPAKAAEATAIFAGGCFWCMEPVFDATNGVISTSVGYTGGSTTNPTYEDVGEGKTGHVEAIEVTYDPSKVNYRTLVDLFFQNIDPFDAQGQFADKGASYRTVVFYSDENEKHIAEQVKHSVEEHFDGKKVATLVHKASTFYPAEDYHQDYYKKNSIRYNLYKHGSGRVTGLKEIWGEQ